MIIQQALYQPTYWQDLHSGQKAIILGVKFLQQTREDPWVLCYHIRFDDGEEQYPPVEDHQSYIIVAPGATP